MKASKGERDRRGCGGFWRDSEVSEVEILEGVSGPQREDFGAYKTTSACARARVIGGGSWYIRHKIGTKLVTREWVVFN